MFKVIKIISISRYFCTRTILLSGIECWACNSDEFDPDMHSECIDEPEIGRLITCSSNQTHCYVCRILSPGPRKIQAIRRNYLSKQFFLQFSGLTFSRGCCEIKDGSPVCPENNGMDDYEFNMVSTMVDISDVMKIYATLVH